MSGVAEGRHLQRGKQMHGYLFIFLLYGDLRVCEISVRIDDSRVFYINTPLRRACRTTQVTLYVVLARKWADRGVASRSAAAMGKSVDAQNLCFRQIRVGARRFPMFSRYIHALGKFLLKNFRHSVNMPVCLAVFRRTPKNKSVTRDNKPADGKNCGTRMHYQLQHKMYPSRFNKDGIVRTKAERKTENWSNGVTLCTGQCDNDVTPEGQKGSEGMIQPGLLAYFCSRASPPSSSVFLASAPNKTGETKPRLQMFHLGFDEVS